MPTRILSSLAFVLALLALPSLAAAKDAPDVTLKDVDGVTHRLSQYRGRWVLLEWTNPDCPSVQALYKAKTVQTLQATWKPQGLVWLTINSTGAGQRGHRNAAQDKAALAALGGTPTAYLLDPTGAAGKAFQAQVTPEVRLLSPKGEVVYAGGIDEIRSAKASDVPRARNFVRLAIADIVNGKPIAIRSSRPYGCSVKY